MNRNNELLDLVHVVLTNNKDSTFIAGGAFRNGEYKFEGILTQDVILRASYVGYKGISKVLNCNIKEDTIRLGDIKLDEIIIDEVTVNAYAPRFKPTERGLQISINNEFMEQNNNVLDVIKMMPGLVVMDNSIKAFNRDNLVIYIDKERVSNIHELSSLEPADIKSVEFIESPGPEFDNNVDAVLIVHRKNKIGDYFKGWANIVREHKRKWSGHESFSLKSNLNKFRYQVYVTNHNYDRVKDMVDSIAYRYEEAGYHENIRSTNRSKSSMKFGYTRIAYENKEHLLSSQFSVLQFGNNYKQSNRAKDLSYHSEYDQYKLGFLYSYSPSSIFNLDFIFNYSKYKNYNYSKNAIGLNFFNKDESDATIAKINVLYKVDKLKMRIRFGGKFFSLDSDNFYSVGGVNYQEKKHSGYISFSKKAGVNFSINGGIRYENLETNSYLLSQKYNYYLPSLRLVYSLKNKKNISWTYKRRMINPRLSDIHDNLSQVDLWLYRRGNPLLKPSITDHYEVSFVNKKFKTNLGVKICEDYLTPNYFADEIDSKPVIFKQKINIKKFNEYYLSGSYSYDSKWFSSYTSFSVNYQELDKEKNISYDIWYFKLKNNTVIRLLNTYTLNISSLFETSKYRGFERYENNLLVSVSLSRRFLNKKILVKAGVRDLFETNTKRKVIDYNDVYISSKYIQVKRAGFISLKWSFGKAKINNIKNIEDSDLDR